MPRKRDRSYLISAAIAGLGGVLAIVTSIGLPLLAWVHGKPAPPVFALFSAWGLAALAGCAANLYMYFRSGPAPEKPSGGGRRPVSLHVLDGQVQNVASAEQERRAA